MTFIGVGRDPHTFGLIADLGHQSFQCAAFWCQPHAGGLSEAVQAACMVSQGWEWVGGIALQLLYSVHWGSGLAASPEITDQHARADCGSGVFYLTFTLFLVGFSCQYLKARIFHIIIAIPVFL